MRKTILLGLAVGALLHQSSSVFENYGVETLGPDISPYAKRPKKGKGARKSNRANRWG